MCKTSSCGGPILSGAIQGEMTPELSFKDGLEFSWLAQGGEGIPGMCKGLDKACCVGELKVGQCN